MSGSCKHVESESINHLFFECPVFAYMWSNCAVENERGVQVLVEWLATVWLIYKQMNKLVFQHSELDRERMKEDVKIKVKNLDMEFMSGVQIRLRCLSLFFSRMHMGWMLLEGF